MVPQPAGPVGTPRLSGQETAHFYDGEDVTPSPHYTDGLPVIRLYTRDGRYVASVPTMPWVKDGDPDVVLWGSRCFVLHRPSLSYREAFAWVCPFDALPEPTPTTEKT